MKSHVFTLFDSLRSRHLFATIMLAMFLLAGIFLAHFTVQQSKESVTQNVASRSEVLQLSRQIRESLLKTYAEMNAFLLEPGDKAIVESMKLSLESAQQYTDVLMMHRWIKQNLADTGISNLPGYLSELSLHLTDLVETRRDPFKQFPTLALSNREMRPYRNSFNNSIALAITEAESELRSETYGPEAFEALTEARHYWTQMVSNYRLYIANRLGSFNESSLPVQEKGIEALYAALVNSLNELSVLDQNSKLGFEASSILSQLEASSNAWYLGFQETRKIHNTGVWRSDKQIIANFVEPQLNLVWELLHTFDKAIENAASVDISHMTLAANEQEKLLWGISSLIFILIIAGFVYSEKVIFKPIAKIALALREESVGRNSAVLPVVSSRETRDLVDAFAAMRMQVRSRQLALEHKSLHDELTGLPNRTLLLDRINQAFISVENTHSPLSVMVIDVANIKEINDTLGHHAGDQLLLEICVRLRKKLAETETLSRVGGNEFALLVCDEDESAVFVHAASLVRNLKQRLVIDGMDIHPVIHLGIAMYPQHGNNANVLLQRADIAMFVSKRQRQDILFYNETDDQFSIDRLGLLADLKKAIKDRTLEMHYQPKLDIVSKKVIGVEALLRWKHNIHGWVQPGDIVSMAEQSGVVNALTQWTFEEAVMQCSKWQKIGLRLNVAINLSVCVLQDENIAIFIKEILNKYNVKSENITLEITESAMMTNPVRVSDILKQLHEIGVSISADDFGTGFSSLSYLKTLPVNEIKIDKSFVMDMVRDSTDSAIVKSAIGLAHNLGLKVVAEGIENQSTQQALQDLSCDIGQGYYFSEPLSASALMRWIKSNSEEVSVEKV